MSARFRLVAVLLFLLSLYALFALSGLREHFSLPALQQLLRAHQQGGLLAFVLLFAIGNLIQIPGWIFLAAAVLVLGRTWGGLVTYLAASSSCLLTFFTIRWLGGDALRRLDHRLANRLLAELDAHPLRSVILLRICFQTVPALNYSLALSGIHWRNYLTGTLLGLPLPIAAYCLFFDQLARWLHWL